MSKPVQVVVGEKSVKVTLYSGADDPDLPDYIKKLPLTIRSRWVSNYNWGVMDTQDDEDAAEQADTYTTVSVDDMSEMLAAMKELGAGGNTPVSIKAVRAVVPTPVKARTPVVTAPLVKEGVQAGSFMQRFKAWLTDDGGEGRAAVVPTNPLNMFSVYKGNDGSMHVLTVYSNIFKDSHQQILSTAAHQEYVAAAEAGKALYPDLYLWHGGPDTKWGTVETVSFVDGFAIAGGVVDPGKEHVALKLKEMADKGELAVSHGFLGLLGSDGVYQRYRPFEISPLPVGSESNPWTGVDFNLKENGMAFTDKKKTWLKTNFGMDDAAITQAEKSFEAMGAALKPLIDYKEGAGETPAPPPPAPTPPDPAPVPPPPNPAGVAAAAVTAEETIMPQITAMAKAIEGLGLQIKALKEAAPAAATAAAEDMVLAKIAAGTGFSPTKDAGNVQAGLKEDDEDDFLAKAFLGIFPNINGNGAQAGAAVGAVPAMAPVEAK